MALSTEKIKQYQKFLSFMLKYWNSNLLREVTSSALNRNLVADSQKDYNQSPQELVDDLVEMGPTYVKLGQLLSTRPDLLPRHYLDALATLQDNAQPIPFQTVREIVKKEHNVPLHKAFKTFTQEPIASASIGQVHQATLPSGMKVAVKVQRPNIQEKFMRDLNTLKEMAGWAVAHTKTGRQYALDEVIEDLRHMLLNELNYTKEAENLLRLRKNLKRFEELVIPKPILDYSTANVLTMEFIKGRKVINLSSFEQLEMDCDNLIDKLVEAYLKQIIDDGFVHADPHPGNIHLTADRKIALLDLGMVAQISPTNKGYLLKLMMALSENNGEKTADILIDMGHVQDDNNLRRFRKVINQVVMENRYTTAKNMQTGRLLIQMNQSAAQNGLRVPVEINILGKVLLNLDQIIKVLAPDFNLREAIKRHINKLMQTHMLRELKPESFFTMMLETKKLTESMPERMNKFTEQLANSDYTLKIDAIDEKRLTDGFQKVANRITIGLIIAATIIGAAMLMNVPTDFTILGYPGLAMIFFLFAAIGGMGLTYYIIFKDENLRM